MSRKHYWTLVALVIISGLTGGAAINWVKANRYAWAQGVDKSGDKIEAGEIILRDKAGRARGKLIMRGESPCLILSDPNGVERVGMYIDDNGPGLAFVDANKQNRLMISIRDYSPIISFFDTNGSLQASLDVVKLQQMWQRPSAKVVIPSTPSTPDVIESCIEGEFEGWDGETIFKLDNGQIWQQASSEYTYHYAYRPEVLIYRTSGGFKMKVEDVEDVIYVKRLK